MGWWTLMVLVATAAGATSERANRGGEEASPVEVPRWEMHELQCAAPRDDRLEAAFRLIYDAVKGARCRGPLPW